MAIRAIGSLVLACAVAGAQPDDWHRLWTPNGATLPEAVKVRVSALGDLGPELESAEWSMVPTKYHQIYYQASADIKTVVEVSRVIDNLYDFLGRRSPAKARLPVRVFLVPGERGKSRCSLQAVAMRTGADADTAFIVSSLMHEETHLFNFAFLGDRAQGWWAGEFSCIYHQERARLAKQGADIKSELSRRLPNGPISPLSSLQGPAQPAFDSALSALYFLEETYGAARMIEFRRQCLISSKGTNGHALPASVFREVFGKDAAVLDREWRAFFGWGAHGRRPSLLPFSPAAP
jgi:hypothetical protein